MSSSKSSYHRHRVHVSLQLRDSHLESFPHFPHKITSVWIYMYKVPKSNNTSQSNLAKKKSIIWDHPEVNKTDKHRTGARDTQQPSSPPPSPRKPETLTRWLRKSVFHERVHHEVAERNHSRSITPRVRIINVFLRECVAERRIASRVGRATETYYAYWETTRGWSGSLPRRSGRPGWPVDRQAASSPFPRRERRNTRRWHYVGVKDSEGWAAAAAYTEIYWVICVYVTRLCAPSNTAKPQNNAGSCTPPRFHLLPRE